MAEATEVVGTVVGTENTEANKIGIMACGKTGIGKSTLLNVLLGTKDKFHVNGPGGESDDCMEAGTIDVISVSERMHGIEVTMYDTPGLQSDHNDNRFITAIENVKGKIDLVLFCVDGVTTRWVAEAQTVKNLHLFFGNEFWMNCIFVITRSNMAQQAIFEDDDLTPEEKVARCEKAATAIFNYFKRELLKLGAASEVVKDIPLVAAGSHKMRKLHFVAPKVYDEDFLPELWSLAVKRCRVQTRIPFAIVSNYKEGRFISQNSITNLSPEDQVKIQQIARVMGIPEPFNDTPSPESQETEPQPVILSKKQSNRIHKALGTSLGVAGAVAGAASGIGTAVGATVLAATSFGAVVAGPIGAGVGVVIGIIGGGVLAGVLIYQYKKFKKLEATDQHAEPGSVGMNSTK